MDGNDWPRWLYWFLDQKLLNSEQAQVVFDNLGFIAIMALLAVLTLLGVALVMRGAVNQIDKKLAMAGGGGASQPDILDRPSILLDSPDNSGKVINKEERRSISDVGDQVEPLYDQVVELSQGLATVQDQLNFMTENLSATTDLAIGIRVAAKETGYSVENARQLIASLQMLAVDPLNISPAGAFSSAPPDPAEVPPFSWDREPIATGAASVDVPENQLDASEDPGSDGEEPTALEPSPMETPPEATAQQVAVKDSNISDREAWAAGYGEINIDHPHLMDQCQRVLELVQGGADEANIIEALAGLRDFSDKYFQDENWFMQEIGYPGTEDHKTDHATFLDRIATLQKKAQNGGFVLPIDIEQKLLGWMENHRHTADAKLTSYARRHHDRGGPMG